MNLFDTVQTSLLGKNLDGLWARAQVIDDNLANAETPGFKAGTVSFEDELRAVMEKKDVQAADVQGAGVTYGETKNLTARLDGNNVDSVAEQAELARTQFNYSLSIRLYTDQMNRLRHVISEGKK